MGVRALAEACLLAAVSLALAVPANRLRREALPLRIPESYYRTVSNARPLLLERAQRMHRAGRAVFLDARGSEVFEKEHILGAFSLPADDGSERVLELEDWLASAPIVVYAGRDQIGWADGVAEGLAGRGHADSLFLLLASFEEWRQAGLPTESGPDPLQRLEKDEEEQP